MDSRLANFVIGLIQNPKKRREYLADSDQVIAQADLGDEEKAVLGSDRFQIILDFLDQGGTRPINPPKAGGG